MNQQHDITEHDIKELEQRIEALREQERKLCKSSLNFTILICLINAATLIVILVKQFI